MQASNPSFKSPDDIQFADPRTLLADALKAFLPAEKIDVADCAARYRYLDNRGGGYVGLWSHDEAPYLVGPMKALTSRTHLTTAIVGPGRSGKTAVGQNWQLQSVGFDPADMLNYAHTDTVIEQYVKAEIEPMIEAHPMMADRLGKAPKLRSLSFKRFRGMWIQYLTATYNNLINKSAPRIIITELDACDSTRGDPYGLADLRRQTFGLESMILAESHPDRAAGIKPKDWTSGIMSLYRDSDRRVWYWPCPHCNGFSSPNPSAGREMVLDWPADAPLDEVRDAARLLCPCCGAEIEDKWRRVMNRDGVWVGEGQEISETGEVTGELVARDIAGFWITGLMSPFIIGGIGSLAFEYEKAKRAYDAGEEDARQKFKDVVVKRWGLPFEEPAKAGSLDAGILAERAEAGLALGRVPPGVRFLTAAVDVQSNRFEILVRGWGVSAESWVVDHWTVDADPATSPGDWDEVLRVLATRIYPLSDGTGRGMRIRAAGYDSGGQEGVTLQAYNAWRRAKSAGLVKIAGRIDGREAWTILPLKGLSTPNAPFLSVSHPDSQRKDRRASARGEIPVGLFNPNRAKDDLHVALQRAESGPLAVHFPADLIPVEPPYPFFEQLVAEERLPNGRWQKKRAGGRNEALDLMVMTLVMANLFGLHRINWNSPPGWCAEWDRNSLVVGLDQAPEVVSLARSSLPQAGVMMKPAAPAPRRRWAR
ncbi:bacteriophage terminase large subunit [Ameyamaea chiangmaiensis NBRC 103196]|uniref:Phage terminase large subunit family protein n=1 Tax=Ameyamaea chiangmaiensis TaxID=442969 RepID=A0A850P8W5_9PROT|nr:terminase gpA endonuclease subunit [Ameyamaea chiangmaiensis]MBS4075458.1 phage terminase large subunit family protein [Ameyamaea chiangmaiensis]NVN39010.1 phage terminase large subunit family protein [Ameyamaea chiangmaiensis]GBQ69690.1 bacteriophage terminase large subunit [Ameyamaea chiangmaiensis NBRC 103196]